VAIGMTHPVLRGPCFVTTLTAAALTITIAASGQVTTPPLTAPVNDFAGVIEPEDEATLDTLIRQLQSASGDVMVVAAVKTFQPAADIRVFANEMFENHGKGIGQKGRDNGLLLVLAVDDREVWAEVGYDLEGIITDGFAGETSRQVMVPFFRQANYGEGLVAGATRFAQRIAEARNVTLDGVPIRQPPIADDDGEFPVMLFIFGAIAIINLIQSVMNRAFGRRGGRRGRRWSSTVGPFGSGYGGWSSGGGRWHSGGGGGFGGGFGGFGGGRSGGGGGGASW
jgi:uncharacterized protein